MTVSPRRLAGLWPWLLMAALQLVLGQTGLELAAAAVESERTAPKAVIKVTPLKQEQAGKPITLEGVFAGAGVRGHAEGRLMQSHPLSLCNTSEDERQESIFISIVKLENPEHQVPQCLPLLEKARLALKRGAQAVIFDVTDDAGAAVELHESLVSSDFLLNPVVLVQAKDAEVLMGLVNRNEEAMVRIEVMIEPPKWPHYDVGILLTVVLAVLAIIMIFAFRYRCKSNRNWDSVHQQTMRAISQLETRTYSSQGCPASQRHGGHRESGSSSGSSPMCAICLEEFLDGQNLRIISCSHEFHKECVDPWLLQHRTCPLCMHNIMGAELAPRQPQRMRHQYPGHHTLQSHPIPFPIRHHYPRVPPGQYPPLRHIGSSPPLDPRVLRCLQNRPLAPTPAHFGYHLPEGHGTRPHRTGSGCRTGRHLSQAHSHRTCYGYRQGCPPPRSASSSRLRASSPPRVATHSRQDDGSCSGGSYRTERSGYFPDGPASDSSSGPCHGSSSDSVLNCTDATRAGTVWTPVLGPALWTQWSIRAAQRSRCSTMSTTTVTGITITRMATTAKVPTGVWTRSGVPPLALVPTRTLLHARSSTSHASAPSRTPQTDPRTGLRNPSASCLTLPWGPLPAATRVPAAIIGGKRAPVCWRPQPCTSTRAWTYRRTAASTSTTASQPATAAPPTCPRYCPSPSSWTRGGWVTGHAAGAMLCGRSGSSRPDQSHSCRGPVAPWTGHNVGATSRARSLPRTSAYTAKLYTTVRDQKRSLVCEYEMYPNVTLLQGARMDKHSYSVTRKSSR